jgi:hypothetical protein
MVLAVGIRRHHPVAVRNRTQGVIDPRLQGRSLSQVHSVLQYLHLGMPLQLPEQLLVLGPAAVIDHDNRGHRRLRQPGDKLSQRLAGPECRNEKG